MSINNIVKNINFSAIKFYGSGALGALALSKGVNYYNAMIVKPTPITLTNIVIDVSMFSVGIRLIAGATINKCNEIMLEDEEFDFESDVLLKELDELEGKELCK